MPKRTINHSNTLLLVSSKNRLAEGYEPESLVEMFDSDGFNVDRSGMMLSKIAYKALKKMCRAALNEGVTGFIVQSGYRSISYQQTLFIRKIESIKDRFENEEEAILEASRVIVPPMSSEHHTGLALDISCKDAEDENGDILSEKLESTSQGKWLYDNSWKFGFTLRYPKHKTEITGVTFEPWHLRYVGLPHAAIMKDKDLCLEEYLDFLASKRKVEYQTKGSGYTIFYLNGTDKADFPLYNGCVLSHDGKGGVIATIKI